MGTNGGSGVLPISDQETLIGFDPQANHRLVSLSIPISHREDGPPPTHPYESKPALLSLCQGQASNSPPRVQSSSPKKIFHPGTRGPIWKSIRHKILTTELEKRPRSQEEGKPARAEKGCFEGYTYQMFALMSSGSPRLRVEMFTKKARPFLTLPLPTVLTS